MPTIAALYHFADLPDPTRVQAPLKALCGASGVRGSLLLAPEGVNGTIAGPRDGIDAVIAFLRALPGFAALDWKESQTDVMPFLRMKVRIKREIVTMGQPGVDPRAGAGRYVAPRDWNAMISAPDVAVIDTRNDYEVAIGSFAGAMNPATATFRDFPEWWNRHGDALAGKRIAMFCTGGIRCEKATSWLRQQGVDEVYHLQGGILRYLEEVPEADSLWQGECYVFDTRVSVGHGLRPGGLTACGACGWPVSSADRAEATFEEGVCCPACAGQYSDADRARFRERQRQIRRAESIGARHLGPESRLR